jgi:hypothetical protein
VLLASSAYGENLYSVQNTAKTCIAQIHELYAVEASVLDVVLTPSSGEGSVGERLMITLIGTALLNKEARISVLGVSDTEVVGLLPVGDGNIGSFYFVPRSTGKYDVKVEVEFTTKERMTTETVYSFIIKNAKENETPDASLFQLPRCAYPSTSGGQGSWLKCDASVSDKEGCLRSGWKYQPRNCSFEIWNDQELANFALHGEPKWIVILGTSVERGIFLMMVDLALSSQPNVQDDDDDDDSNTQAYCSHCWGYCDYQIGNLRFTYQDARAFVRGYYSSCNTKENLLETDLRPSDHVDFYNFLFGQLRKPDLILVPSRPVSGSASQSMIQSIRDFLEFTRKYDVPVMPLVGYNSPSVSKFGFHIDDELKSMKQWNALTPIVAQLYANGGTALFIGLQDLIYPAVDNNQDFYKGGKCSHGSAHLHLSTSRKAYMSAGRPIFRSVVSDVTEMVASMILSYILGPKSQSDVSLSTDETYDLSTVCAACVDCPHGLLPFHMKGTPEPRCFYDLNDVLSNTRMKMEAHVPTPCPQSCFDHPVNVINETTESGVVSINICAT